MITKSTSYKLVRRSDNQILDEGNKKDMTRKCKPVSDSYFVGYGPNGSIGSTFGAKAKLPHKLRKTIAKFNHKGPTTKDLLTKFNSGFPEASRIELARANRPKFEHYSTNGKGETVRVDPTPREGCFKTKPEGRIVGVMPKKREAKLKAEIWRIEALCGFFRREDIHADATNGWFVPLKSGRLMTAADQLDFFLDNPTDEIEIKIDRNLKHLVIGEII